MAQRFQNPFPQFWSSSAPYSGGTLTFFASGTSTPLAVYSDKTAVTSIGTSLTLNSAGRYVASDIFLSNVDYKVVLKDSDGVTVWTADPVRGSDFTSVPLWSIGSGSPSGVVAGTAGSSGVMPSAYWDYTNSILYFCTTTGSASTAVWTAVNATATQPSVPPPQGYLTPTSATPVILSDSTSATSIFYTPFNGNLVPIYNGSSLIPLSFSELTLTLASQHATSTLYDVFVFSNSGVVTLATGPAWTTNTAGSCARGSGAGTTQIARVLGVFVNSVSMTGRNGATTYTIGANLGTYLGTIFIDSGAAGQVTCHTSYGQSRKWGIWNMYNRREVCLKCGDGTASWAYVTATIRQSNAGATNLLTTLCGVAEEPYELRMAQKVIVDSATDGLIGIGVNSTTVMSGTVGSIAFNPGVTQRVSIAATHRMLPALGINNINALEKGTGSASFFGTEANMLLEGAWRA